MQITIYRKNISNTGKQKKDDTQWYTYMLYYYSMIKLRPKIYGIVGVLCAVLCWEVLSANSQSSAMPSFIHILQTFFVLALADSFRAHIIASLQVVLSGIGIAIVFGLSIGVMAAYRKRFKYAIMPIIECLRGISALTLFPLLIVIMGLGSASQIFVIFWTSWPPVLLSVLDSLEIGATLESEAARMDGAGEWKILTAIRFPLALPYILTGIRVGFSGGWVSLIAAEMLGASNGLGFFLLWSAQSFDFNEVYATILTIGLIGGAINWMMIVFYSYLRRIYG